MREKKRGKARIPEKKKRGKARMREKNEGKQECEENLETENVR